MLTLIVHFYFPLNVHIYCIIYSCKKSCLDFSKRGYPQKSNNCLSSVSGLGQLTQLLEVDVSNNKLTKLPSLKKFKNLILEHTSFSDNKISEKEFKKKLPSKIPSRWINYQVFNQNTKRS